MFVYLSIQCSMIHLNCSFLALESFHLGIENISKHFFLKKLMGFQAVHIIALKYVQIMKRK